jgi:fatty-acid desaturase
LKQDDLRFIHKHYYLLLLLIILVLISIDFAVLVLAFSLPALLCWVSAVSVGIIPHLNKEGTVATNSVLTALLSTGEGWHLNHHQSPRDYQQGRTWWQIDVAAILIRILKVKDDKS